MAAGSGPRSNRQVRKIASNQSGSVEIFNLDEPKLPRASVQFPRIEIAPERLPTRRDPLRQLLMMSARRGICEPIGRVGVVEHDFGPARPARELTERR